MAIPCRRRAARVRRLRGRGHHHMVNQRLAPAPIEARHAVAWWDDDRLDRRDRLPGRPPRPGRLRRALRAGARGRAGDLPRRRRRLRRQVPARPRGAPARPSWPGGSAGPCAGPRPARRTWSPWPTAGARCRPSPSAAPATAACCMYRIEVLQDAGAYPHMGAVLPFVTRMMASGVYDIPGHRVQLATRSLTTTTPDGRLPRRRPPRGHRRPRAHRRPVRRRGRHGPRRGAPPQPRRRRRGSRSPRPTGTVYDSGDYPAALDRALDAAGYDELRAEQARRREGGDRRCSASAWPATSRSPA